MIVKYNHTQPRIMKNIHEKCKGNIDGSYNHYKAHESIELVANGYSVESLF